MSRYGAIKGITIRLGADFKDLQTSLRDVDQSLRTTQSQLKEVNQSLKLNPNNVDLLRQKSVLLNQKIEETENSLKGMKEALKQMDAKGVDKTSQEYMELEREIINTESKLKSLNKEQKQFIAESSKLGQVASKMKSVGDKATQLSQKLRGVSTGAQVALAGAVAVTASFDSSMSKVMAISGATGDEFDKLRDKAREMGAKTKFSAEESADALTYMAMAGWKTEDMLDGLEGIMYLASASGEDLATTSDIVTDALTAMGYSAKESGQLADVMASASANANTNVGLMGETFKYVASVAGSLHYSMQDVALATGLMANAGIKGSQAGTSLRSMLARMSAPTKQVAGAMESLGISIENADGTTRPFRDVMIDLREKMQGLTDVEKNQVANAIAGKNAMSGFLAIVNATDEDFNNLAYAIDNSNGSAEEMANTMNDNLGGQLIILKSALQELAISMGDTLVPMVRAVVGVVQGLVDKFNGLSDTTKTIITYVVMVVGALAPALAIFGGITNLLSSGILAFAKWGTAINKVAGLFSKLGTTVLPIVVKAIKAVWTVLSANPIGIVITVVGLLVAGFVTLYKKSETFRNAVDKVWSRLKSFASSCASIGKTIVSKIGSALKNVGDIGLNIVKGIGKGITSGISWIVGVIKSFTNRVKSSLKSFFGIASPSKWARDTLGYNLVKGFAVGIEQNAPMLQTAVDSLMPRTNTQKFGYIMGESAVTNSSIINIGDVTLDASSLEDVVTVQGFVDVAMRAKGFTGRKRR